MIPYPNMAIYSKVLAVLDLSEDSDRIAHRAAEMAAAQDQCQLTLLHVVELIPVEPLNDALLPSVQIESELRDRARLRLSALAETLHPVAQTRVETGSVKAEILRVARELAADLIVIGSRERHGLSILVNLTEDTVLHAAPCDVLAVRLHAKRAAS